MAEQKKAKRLKLDWTELSMDPKWYVLETMEWIPEPNDEPCIQVRPMPSEMVSLVIKEGGVVVSGEQQKEMYDFCLTGWWNFEDREGNDLPFSEEAKALVYKFQMAEIPNKVVRVCREFEDKKKDQEKN